MPEENLSIQTIAPLAIRNINRYCIYARKSSESDEKQALSIDSQIKELTDIALRDGLNVTAVYRESHSAKDSGQRPVYNQLLQDIREGKFTGILVWHPDRLSRNAGDLGSLVDLMDQKLLQEIQTYGQKFTNSPSEKFLLMILCSQAKLENDNKSVNVKRGMRARVEMGLWPGTAPVGYLNEKRVDHKCEVIIDPERSWMVKEIFEKCAHGWSGRRIYYWLRFEMNFRTVRNKQMSLSNIYYFLRNHFYYGIIEYPKESGKFYTGRHQPLITKELFQQVQENLKRGWTKQGNKEFAFTKLMVCGMCGSGITAEEKFRQRIDGSTAHYIYYGCTGGKRMVCKNTYIREDSLITQLLKLMDEIDVNELGMKHKFHEEMQRYNRFRQEVLRLTEKPLDQFEVDARTYAKYVLREGTTEEKRELLALLKGRISVTAKKVSLVGNKTIS